MFRKDLIDQLLHHPATLRELSVRLEEPIKDMESDLRHLLKSLHHLPYRVVITPAQCNKCHFIFHREKLHKPSKCPCCKSNWISEPRIVIEKDS